MRPSSVRIIAQPVERGAERNALGRSRGGFSTKINARTNAEGLPIGVVITVPQAERSVGRLTEGLANVERTGPNSSGDIQMPRASLERGCG